MNGIIYDLEKTLESLILLHGWAKKEDRFVEEGAIRREIDRISAIILQLKGENGNKNN